MFINLAMRDFFLNSIFFRNHICQGGFCKDLQSSVPHIFHHMTYAAISLVNAFFAALVKI